MRDALAAAKPGFATALLQEELVARSRRNAPAIAGRRNGVSPHAATLRRSVLDEPQAVVKQQFDQQSFVELLAPREIKAVHVGGQLFRPVPAADALARVLREQAAREATPVRQPEQQERDQDDRGSETAMPLPPQRESRIGQRKP
jgi:hypothetical protein